MIFRLRSSARDFKYRDLDDGANGGAAQGPRPRAAAHFYFRYYAGIDYKQPPASSSLARRGASTGIGCVRELAIRVIPDLIGPW